MESLIFWYTGATIWSIIAMIVLLLTIIAAILTIATTARILRQFWFIKKFCTAVTEGDMDRVRRAYQQACLKYGEPFKGDGRVERAQDWLTHLAWFYNLIGDEYTKDGNKKPPVEKSAPEVTTSTSEEVPLTEYTPAGHGSMMKSEPGGGWMDADEVRRYVRELKAQGKTP